MISIVETGNVYDFRGLSTDEKPLKLKVFQDKYKTVGNGSTFFELDTGDLYVFDAEGEQWNLVFKNTPVTPPGSSEWGSIAGNINSQVDLMNKFNDLKMYVDSKSDVTWSELLDYTIASISNSKIKFDFDKKYKHLIIFFDAGEKINTSVMMTFPQRYIGKMFKHSKIVCDFGSIIGDNVKFYSADDTGYISTDSFTFLDFPSLSNISAYFDGTDSFELNFEDELDSSKFSFKIFVGV